MVTFVFELSFSLFEALKNLRISPLLLTASSIAPFGSPTPKGVGSGKHAPTKSSSCSTKKPGNDSKTQNLLFN